VKPIRSKKIMQAARGEECTVRSPTCNYDPETTVAAHSNMREHGKAMGRKADDLFVAFACSDCHRWIDEGPGDRFERDQAWREGHDKTLYRLYALGILVIK
jgi:hypothetical protein